MSAILAGADGFVSYIVHGRADSGGGSLIFLFPERRRKEPKDQPREKHENPGHQVYDPPPPADGEPPEAAVPLFLVFGLCFGCGN